MFWSSKKRRREALLAEPFRAEWLSFLERGMRQYSLLSADEQAKLRNRLRIFIDEKDWVGCGGLTVTEEMQVVIAAQACLLTLGLKHEYFYDRIRTVLVYPDTYLHPPGKSRGLLHESEAIAGEYWHRGPVIVSWKNARDGMDGRGNLVFHEFAHHLDDIDGEMDGMPPLEGTEQERRWEQVVSDEYHRLVITSARGEVTLLDRYGATSLAEFFAVATECFFERPIALAKQHPELYEVLRDFYGQHPAGWRWPADLRGADAEPSAKQPSLEDDAASVEETVRAMRLRARGADAYFARGVMYAAQGNYEQALQAFDEALRLTPRDAEAYRERADVKLSLGRYEEGVADAARAMELDPDDLEALCLRGEGMLALGQYKAAIEDCTRVLAANREHGHAYHLRGHAHGFLNDWRAAVADYSQALRFTDQRAIVYRDRADAWETLGELEKARADREQAYRLDPSLREE